MLLDRSLNFLARPRRRRGRKRRVFFFPPRERIIPLDCTIKREREGDCTTRLLLVKGTSNLWDRTHLSLERKRRVLSCRGKIFFRGAFPVREIKDFERTLNDTRRWQIRTSTGRRGGSRSNEFLLHFSLLLFDTPFERSSGKKERTTKVYDGKIVRIGPN